MRIAAFLVLLSLALASWAQEPARCTWEGVGQKYSVNPYLLYSIAKTESGLRPDRIGRNPGGSYDIGLMQINSSWLPMLRKHGVDEQKLLDPCINLEWAAWILRDNITRLGNTWNAVGAYNARSQDKRVKYAKKVLANLPREAFLNDGHGPR